MEADELRGAAALLVLFYHSMHFGLAAIGQQDWPRTANPLLAFIYEGHTGVSLFIVLSGFILATGSFGSQLSYAGFIRNRALRILPLALLVFLFSIYSANELTLDRVLVPLMPLVSKSYGSLDPAQLTGTIWTAFVEFQLYLIAPFLFLFTAQRGILRFLLPLGLSILLLKAMEISTTDQHEAYRISYFTVIGRVNQFLAGIVLAYAFDKDLIPKQLREGRAPAFALIGVTAAILGFVTLLSNLGGLKVLNRGNIIYQDIEGWLWAAFIGSYILCKPFRGTVVSVLLNKLALISFSLYVLHYSVLVQFWNKAFPKLQHYVPSTTPVLFLLSAAIAVPIIALATLTYNSIEAPFLKLRVRYVSDNVAEPRQRDADV